MSDVAASFRNAAAPAGAWTRKTEGGDRNDHGAGMRVMNRARPAGFALIANQDDIRPGDQAFGPRRDEALGYRKKRPDRAPASGGARRHARLRKRQVPLSDHHHISAPPGELLPTGGQGNGIAQLEHPQASKGLGLGHS